MRAATDARRSVLSGSRWPGRRRGCLVMWPAPSGRSPSPGTPGPIPRVVPDGRAPEVVRPRQLEQLESYGWRTLLVPADVEPSVDQIARFARAHRSLLVRVPVKEQLQRPRIVTAALPFRAMPENEGIRLRARTVDATDAPCAAGRRRPRGRPGSGWSRRSASAQRHLDVPFCVSVR
jgi:hypothetical protein